MHILVLVGHMQASLEEVVQQAYMEVLHMAWLVVVVGAYMLVVHMALLVEEVGAYTRVVHMPLLVEEVGAYMRVVHMPWLVEEVALLVVVGVGHSMMGNKMGHTMQVNRHHTLIDACFQLPQSFWHHLTGYLREHFFFLS